MKWKLHLIAIFVVTLTLLFVASLWLTPGGDVLSAPPPLPTAIPPTSESTPDPTPETPASISGGMMMILRVKPVDAQLWTVVQWQDGEGKWHTVDGWRGNLDMLSKSEGWKYWFYGEDLLGKGPFRWQIYSADGDTLLATSDAFVIPDSASQPAIVDVFLYE